MSDQCQIPGCRGEVGIVYLDHDVCLAHWNEYTNETAPPDALRMALGIEGVPETEEEITMSKTKNAKKTSAAKIDGAVEEASEPKSAKKERKAREPKEKIPMRTVALRVSEAEFETLHSAAGPRNLSAFMKTALLAAANRAIAK